VLAEHAVATDRFAREIVPLLKVVPGALAAAERQPVGPLPGKALYHTVISLILLEDYGGVVWQDHTVTASSDPGLDSPQAAIIPYRKQTKCLCLAWSYSHEPHLSDSKLEIRGRIYPLQYRQHAALSVYGRGMDGVPGTAVQRALLYWLLRGLARERRTAQSAQHPCAPTTSQVTAQRCRCSAVHHPL
jgi:hypothetical protein